MRPGLILYLQQDPEAMSREIDLITALLVRSSIRLIPISVFPPLYVHLF